MNKNILKITLLFTLILTVFFNCITPLQAAQAQQDRTESLISELDYVISRHATYINLRRKEIHRLKKQLKSARSPKEVLDTYGQLYTQYNSFDADSALLAAQDWLAAARRMNSKENILRAELSLAETYSKAGMFKEAIDLVQHIQKEPIVPQIKTLYYHILRSTYGYMTEYSINPAQANYYQREANRLRDTILTLYPRNSETFAIVQAGKWNEQHKAAAAFNLLTQFMNAKGHNVYGNAIFMYTLAETCRLRGDKESYKRYLIHSSIDDIKSGTREYLSLFRLSLLLYEEGDIERAYTYFQTCLDDAQKSNSRLRIIELIRIFPQVNKAYQEKIREQRLREHIFLLSISLLSLALIIGIGFIWRQTKRLKELNEKLRLSNEELTNACHAVAENSHLKEEYIGRYMDQCSTYIDKLSDYRSGLIKIINTGVMKDLIAKIRSTIDLDDELKEFYANFDETFLQLFPSFVEEFNALLAPQYRIELKNSRQLNTELRIFALIRLGITDSVKIAQFLRYSVTTIYNYRTKTRNKALGDRNKFEGKVMKIGKIAD